MKRLGKIAKADYKYVPAQPDADFSPEHNKMVIEESIRKHEAKIAAIQRDLDKSTGERVDAATMYLKSLDKGGASSDIESYFGKEELLRLRGEQIIAQLRNGKKES